MRFRAHDAAVAVGGRLVGPDVEIDGVSFDSRSLQPGNLFVPIVAARDGHDFIADAVAHGAAAHLTARPASGAATAIEVDDTLAALMRLATWARGRFHGPVVGITGSVGKTTTKDLTAAALGASRRTWANERSFNNDQGLPTTVLNTPESSEVLVLEMGMRGFGEIARLCAIARPTVGIVTRVAEAHGDRVGGIEGVARAKAELVTAIAAEGVVILNGDDSRVVAMAGSSAARVLTFGAGDGCDVRIEGLMMDAAARPSFTLDTPWGRVEVHLALAGRHMAWNAAAAIACVGAIGADVVAGALALRSVEASPMRMRVVQSTSGVTVVDDCYNANPTSMRAAIDALVSLPASRRIAILGVMAEISDTAEEHAAIVDYARARDVEVLAVGTELYGVPTVDDPIGALGSLTGGEAVLVKGSRVAGLERVVAGLLP